MKTFSSWRSCYSNNNHKPFVYNTPVNLQKQQFLRIHWSDLDCFWNYGHLQLHRRIYVTKWMQMQRQCNFWKLFFSSSVNRIQHPCDWICLAKVESNTVLEDQFSKTNTNNWISEIWNENKFSGKSKQLKQTERKIERKKTARYRCTHS